MNSQDHASIRPIDIHAALARAHADRAEYIRIALTGVPALLKRLTGRLRPNRQRLPQAGAWA
jgi:hypothetical protein